MHKIITIMFLILLLILSGCNTIQDAQEKVEQEVDKLICKENLKKCEDICAKLGDFNFCHDLCKKKYNC